MPPSPPPINRPHLIIVAAVEGIALTGAVLRMGLSNGAITLEQPAHLAWFIGTALVAASSVAHFVLRSILLRPRVEAGEDVTAAQFQVFVVSIGMAACAAGLALAGPAPFERFFHGG